MLVSVLVQFVAFAATCVAANPGQCPPNDGNIGGICVEQCSSDSDCLSYQKCCSNGCGHSCVGIIRPRIAHKPRLQCPSVDVDGDSVGVCVEQCSTDGECEAGAMCCSNGCGHACVTAVETPAKPGQCPVTEVGRTDSVGNCSNDCGSDGDCQGDLKCCIIGCSYVCAEPARGDTNGTKSGICPVEHGFGICSESCSVDGDCPGDMKCCSNGCGHVCVIPNRNTELGTCPEVVSGQMGTCSEDCSSDGECPSQQRCCSNGCGHSCTDTARPAKQGECPVVPEDVGGICSEDCSSDVDCDGPAKCCSNGCGHACMEPVEVAAPEPGGQCPAVPDGAELGICSEECSSDVDCEGAQRCCSNGCGHKCMDTTPPVITHDFGCRQGENLYRHEESVPADEDCKSCRCIDGGVICMVRDPCKQQGLFSKALAMPIILSASGVLISLVLMIVIVRCFLLRKTSTRSSYKLMHEVSEFERIPGASNGKIL